MPLFFDDYNISGKNDIYENDNQFGIDIELSGYDKESINLSIEENSLIINAERKKRERGKYTVKQILTSKFKKSYVLPKNVNIDNISAEYVDGILSITIPKQEKEKSIKTIKIK